MPDYFDPVSTVTLCKVPWDSDYTDVVDWSIVDKATYFAGISKDDYQVLSHSAYMPLGVNICVDVPYNVARRYNYCIVTNPAQVEGDEPYTLYYFITGTGYTNPASTTLSCSLDVWTTRIDEVTFDIGYVERSSCALVNAPLKNATNYPLALNRYCTQSDGVSGGDMYYTYKVDTVSVSSTDSPDWISIVSTASFEDDPGTVSNPKLNTAKGNYYGGVYSGCEVYFIRNTDFRKFMEIISNIPWVSQCIISLSTIPSIMVDENSIEKIALFENYDIIDFYRYKNSYNTNWAVGTPPSTGYEIDIENLKSDARFNDVTSPYRSLDKLNCYPYSVIELSTSMSGQSVFLKPECLGSNKVALSYICCAIQPFASIAVFPEHYGSFTEGTYQVQAYDESGVRTRELPYGELLNCAVWLDDFPQWSVVNNAYIAYMASTAHTRQYQYDSASWTLRRSNMGASTVYANSTLEASSAYANAQNEIAVSKTRADWERGLGMYNTVTAGLSGALTAVNQFTPGYGFDVVGGISTLANTAINVGSAYGSMMATNEINNASINSMQQIASRNQATSLNVAGNNIALANSVNKGDYDMQVKAIDASYADAALTQPSQSGNTGGGGLRYSNGVYYTVEVKYKTLNDDAIVRNGDYFYRFGYAINRYMHVPERLVVNKYYSYWRIQQLQTRDTRSNEDEKNVIKGIFSKGVTVWMKPDKIGKVIPRDNLILDTEIKTYYT